MGQTATVFQRWLRAGEKSLHAVRLNIGPRLALCFVFILLLMLGGDAVVLWQFHLVRAEAERLNDIDQKLIAVLRVHTSLLAFYDRLEELVDAEDASQLVTGAEPLRTAVLDEARRARNALSLLPSDLRRDPTILPTLEVLQSALPAQFDAIYALATSGDWKAVRRRLVNQVGPLELLTSALVEKVDREVGEEQVQIVQNTRQVEQRVFLIVPTTAVLTLLIAGTMGLAITRSITQPLERLMEGSKAIARGEFQHRVAISGDDELAHLGRVFNDTAHRLQDLYATLQSSEDRLRRVIDTVPAVIWSTRPDGVVDFISQRWSEYTGRPVEDGLGWKWEEALHPEDSGLFVAEWRAALASGQPMRTEVRVRATNGEYRWWSIRNVPLRDERGNMLKWYGSGFDIDAGKRAEEALRRTQEELAHVSRVTTLGELAASIAHEVNQPLFGIVTSANACLRWLSADPPNRDEVRAAAQRIVRDGKRAGDIIARIRALLRKSDTTRTEFDVNKKVQEVVSLTQGEAVRKGIAVKMELASDLPDVLGNPVELQQVILNLIMNAIEATASVSGRPRELRISTAPRGPNEVLVTVQDTGLGIPSAQVEEIFHAFYTTKPQGIGMGLAICRSIIERHGGRLWVEQNQGPGATFRFTVPSV